MKHHFLLSPEEINHYQNNKSPLPVDGCQKMHMIAYHPDGSIQSKVKLCSCEQRIDDEFTSCLVEKGKIV